MTERSKGEEGAAAGPHTAARGELQPAPGGISAGAPGGVIVGRLPDQAARGDQVAPQRVRGRPEGARNLRDAEIADALIEQYGDPLEADVAIGAAAIGDLVTMLRVIASDRGLKLGMTIGDVVRWQADCRRNAMNYLHARRAAVDAKGKTVVPIIGMGTLPEAAGAGEGRSMEDVIEGEVIQEVSEGENDKSQDGKSHDDAND